MKITLIQPPFKNYAVVNPPLGLAYLAAVLRRHDHLAQITVIDANALRLSIAELVGRVIESAPDAVGFTMTSPQVAVSLEAIRQIKSVKKIPVIVGGPHPTVREEELMREDAIDVVVRSEAEETIVQLYEYFKGSGSLGAIKGISFKEQGRLFRNPDRPLIEDLDRLPFPAWELFPLGRYGSIAGKSKFCLPIMSSRGCPFGCIFCYKGVFGRQYRVRSPSSVIEELRYLVDTFGIREFVILDDNFALDEARAVQICEGIIKSRIGLPWRLSNSVAVKSSSSQLFLKLKEAGCYQVSIGVESGNQRVLDHIQKGIRLDQIENTFRLAKEAGLETVAFFMIGNLSENEQTMDETIRFAVKLDPDFAQFTVATPYPGTQMYDIVKAQGRLLSDNWEDFASYAGVAVFAHKDLTPALMERKYKEAYRRFYLRPRYILKRLRKMLSWREFLNTVRGAGLLCRMIGGKKR
ncbi:MAG TPA: radical SAM protein [Patescibacteria group bacterium]|nr:radical SAM protein [Patescibacteria group bacterium]